jgi:hypothetical protein
MFDKIKSAFGFLAGLPGWLVKLTGIVDLLSGIIKVGMARDDASKVEEACNQWAEASEAVRAVLDEADQAFIVVKAAVNEAGDGGKDITYNEIKIALSEAKDVGPAMLEANHQLGDVLDELKKLA